MSIWRVAPTWKAVAKADSGPFLSIHRLWLHASPYLLGGSFPTPLYLFHPWNRVSMQSCAYGIRSFLTIEGRYKSKAILDDAVVFTCMSYDELNPVRAKMAETPKESDFTIIQ